MGTLLVFPGVEVLLVGWDEWSCCPDPSSLVLRAVSFLTLFSALLSPRGQASGEALPEIQGDGEEVCLGGFCVLQLQRPSVVSDLGFVSALWFGHVGTRSIRAEPRLRAGVLGLRKAVEEKASLLHCRR